MASNTINANLKPIVIGEARETLSQYMQLIRRMNIDGAFRQGELLAGAKGDTLNVAVPAPLSASSVTPAAVPSDPTAITVNRASVTVDKLYKAEFALTTQDWQNYELSSFARQQISEAVRACVFQMNADSFALYDKITDSAGTAGTGFFASNADGLADLHKVLDDRNVPEAMRSAVWSTKDMAAFRKLDQVQFANYNGTDRTTRTGEIGDYLGFEHAQDQQVPIHTTGSITGTPDVNATEPVGETSIAVACGSGEAVALKEGDLITFSENTDNVYSVAADVTINASASGTVTITEGLVEQITSSSAVALQTGHGTSLVNIAGDFMGFTFVNRYPKEAIIGVEPLGDSMPIIDPQTGITLMMTAYPAYFQTIFEVSCLYGVDVTDYRRLARAYSYAS